VSGKLRVGLTGGIGAGKSAAAELFAQWGATVVDADRLAREVVAPGSDGLRAIAAQWPDVVDASGALVRARLAAIVFADDAARAQLNAIVHPAVRALGAQREREAPDGLVVHVVPLLFETDFWRMCDATVLVSAPLALRVDRVIARDGVTAADVERRIAAQIDPAVARERATFVIENDGDLAVLRERMRPVYDALMAQWKALGSS
jgi:dephospho-CoA kinase